MKGIVGTIRGLLGMPGLPFRLHAAPAFGSKLGFEDIHELAATRLSRSGTLGDPQKWQRVGMTLCFA